MLAVPHLLTAEASAYYHGYIMAEMAVHQTRAHFIKEDGHLVDNPRIGPALAEHYWRPGNAVSFDDTLRGLTGIRLEALETPGLPTNGPGASSSGNFSVSECRVAVGPIPAS